MRTFQKQYTDTAMMAIAAAKRAMLTFFLLFFIMIFLGAAATRSGITSLSVNFKDEKQPTTDH
jgi:hypothetical protein